MNIKRQRGRGRNKPTNNNPNRAYESTGPDIKVRGSAQTILEKYQQVGRDAMASGDRILAENYMQHAEHYLRLLKSIQPHFVPRSELAISGIPSDGDEDAENNELAENEGENIAEGEEDENEASLNRNERYNRNDRNNRNDRFNNNRRRGRDYYRNNRNEGAEGVENTPDAVEASNEPQNDAPQIDDANPENGEEVKTRAPRGNSRLRSPLGRRPRPKREGEPREDKEPAGFGEDMPAFLATSVSE